MEKTYEPQKYEDDIYKRWMESGFFNPDKCVEKGVCDKDAESFSIVLPPPNVTGTLHIGHASMLAIQDLMVRYHRMKGDKTLWLPGTDHAAIATQTKVEKLLIEKGMKDPRKELGREKFLKEVDKFAQESHDTIVNQSKKMGSSLDWSREAFTLDEQRNLAVRTVFKKMYDDGLIYRGFRIVNWCPRCHSTLADDEVEHKETKGKMYWIKYGPFVLATTRPETKLGDTAVAVNPKDKRYKEMVGKQYMIPGVLGEFEITVVADDAVDMEFGSGAVKVTPYHSFTDYEIAQRHGIKGKQIIDEDGKMMENCGKYAGMTTLEARKAIVADMEKVDLIDKVEDYENNLSVCYRCNNAIEPIPSKQWFIDVNKKFKLPKSNLKNIKDGQEVSLKELMQTVVRSKQIEIIPERFDKTYFHWIDNLRDWCISRQIWYGHQIPVWYKGNEIYVGVEAPEDVENWEQDPDTLDTWFSSGLWTFSTLGYPDLNAADLKTFHPTSVMETGYDILFFWVARMILMTTYVLGEIPFETVYLHGLVRDEKGKKMSKSLGNVIDPLDTIREYGADATRLSLLIGNTPGNDSKLSEEKIAGYRNFANKLWNISRFMLMNIDEPKKDIESPEGETLSDKWILARLDQIISEVTKDLEEFRFSLAGEKLRDFTWNELADWYLEISKIEENKSDILNYILNTVLKLWHPFMPFVTETLYQNIYGEGCVLMVEKWPEGESGKGKVERVEDDFELLQNIIVGIRSLRADYKIDPVKKLDVIISAGDKKDLLQENSEVIKRLERLEDLKIEIKAKKPEGFVGFVEGGVEVFVKIFVGTGLDLSAQVEKQKQRLNQEITELEKYTSSLDKKLSNKKFVANAPEEVVTKEKEKLEEGKVKLKKLKGQLGNLN